MSKNQYQLTYRGSLFWLIFWTIFFFPIALVLLLTTCSFQTGQKTYKISYHGSRFWLCFWVLIFFPIAIVLLFVKGLSVTVLNNP